MAEHPPEEPVTANRPVAVRLWMLEKDGARAICERGGTSGRELSLYIGDDLAWRQEFAEAFQSWGASLKVREFMESQGWSDVFASLKARSFWHVFDAESLLASNNLAIFKGRVRAVSYERAVFPGMAGAVSPYEIGTGEKAKERVFESVRVEGFAEFPSRLGALFLFITREDAETANREWWGGRRVILLARVVECLAFGEFDSKHLDQRSSDLWMSAAESYWSGRRTDTPRMEALLCGIIELDGWEPYGRLWAPDPQPLTPTT